jgi:hypothetical protein
MASWSNRRSSPSASQRTESPPELFSEPLSGRARPRWRRSQSAPGGGPTLRLHSGQEQWLASQVAMATARKKWPHCRRWCVRQCLSQRVRGVRVRVCVHVCVCARARGEGGCGAHRKDLRLEKRPETRIAARNSKSGPRLVKWPADPPQFVFGPVGRDLRHPSFRGPAGPSCATLLSPPSP